mgnify:CR=1 FL=1
MNESPLLHYNFKLEVHKAVVDGSMSSFPSSNLASEVIKSLDVGVIVTSVSVFSLLSILFGMILPYEQ